MLSRGHSPVIVYDWDSDWTICAYALHGCSLARADAAVHAAVRLTVQVQHVVISALTRALAECSENW